MFSECRVARADPVEIACLGMSPPCKPFVSASVSAKTITSTFACVAARVRDEQRLLGRWLRGICPGWNGLYRWSDEVVSDVRLGRAEGFDAHDRFARRVGGVEVDAADNREVVIAVGVLDDLA
jgi:hypothetical protein